MFYVEDYHASVLIIGPKNKTILIIKDWKEPALWKFPGGKREDGEDPFATAIREIKEETGLVIKRENLRLVSKLDIKADAERYRRDHTKYFFVATIDSFDELIPKGDDGERTAIFDITELDKMVDMLPDYYRFYLDAKEAGFV